MPVQEEEDARELKFGEAFDKAKCLSISEVQVSVSNIALLMFRYRRGGL